MYLCSVGYPYEDLYEQQFEDLVVECMRKLFGIGVQSFAPGKDGGRDARFNGTADRFPSEAAPWTGQTVGQAKHTLATNAHYGEAKFSNDTPSSTVVVEAKRVKKLVEAGEVDGYIFFTNRRLGGTTEQKVRKLFAKHSGLSEDRIHLCGVEMLDDLIYRYPDIPELAGLKPLDGPLLIGSKDIAEVIIAIAEILSTTPAATDSPVVDRISYDDKNVANNMSPEFAKHLEKQYLSYSAQIGAFLADPGNTEFLNHYNAAVDDFQIKVIEKRADFESFDALFNHLTELLIQRDTMLSKERKLTRAMLFFMYWNCDLGVTPDAAA